MASKINANEIRRETDGSKLDSEDLNSKVQQITSSLPDASMSLNKSRNFYEQEMNKSNNASEALNNFVSVNEKIQDQIKTVS